MTINVYGSDAGLEWHQEHPNQLLFKPIDKPVEVWSRGNAYVAAKSAAAARGTRVPAGHPEGFLEAFANNYINFAEAILLKEAGQPVPDVINDFPKAGDGIRGMLFIENAVKSAGSAEKWTELPRD